MSTMTNIDSVNAVSNPQASTLQLPIAPPSTPECTQNIFELVKLDHRYVEQLYACYNQTTDLAEKRRIASIIIKELSVHGVAEELSWYNLLKQKLTITGNNLRSHSMEEHAAMKKELEKLDSMTIINKEFDKQLQECMMVTSHHVEEEEQNVIPPLQQHCTEEEMKQMKLDWFTAKAKAPTRPHSWLPATGGMMQEIAGAIVKPFDKMKDTNRFGEEAQNERPKSEL